MNTPAHMKQRWSLGRFAALLIIAWAGECSFIPYSRADTNYFRFGFSSATFADVNENDAIAALKVWAKIIARERNIALDPQPQVFKTLENVDSAVRARQVDALALNTDEVWRLRSELDENVFIAGVTDGQITEQYILLVHRDSGITNLLDLRGRNLALLKNARMSLAGVWFDTMLGEKSLPESSEFCQISQFPKLTKVVIPVFFRQIDACVVNLRGFQTMCELNPQLKEKLQIIATSPELVPCGFCFRRDYTDPFRETLVQELEKLVSTPAGAQVLTLFQSGAIKAQPGSCLDSAFELLSHHDQVRGVTNSLVALHK